MKSTSPNGLTPFVPAWMFKQGLAPTEFMVLSYLWMRRNCETGQCNPSADKIAEDIGISRRTVFYALKTIQAKGLFEHTQGHTKKSNSYRLQTPEQCNGLHPSPTQTSASAMDCTRTVQWAAPQRYSINDNKNTSWSAMGCTDPEEAKKKALLKALRPDLSFEDYDVDDYVMLGDDPRIICRKTGVLLK